QRLRTRPSQYVSSPRLSATHSSFFFNDPATTAIYTLSLHDALPISQRAAAGGVGPLPEGSQGERAGAARGIRDAAGQSTEAGIPRAPHPGGHRALRREDRHAPRQG